MRLLLKMPPRVVCCSSGQAPSKCASPSQCQCCTRAAGQGSRQGAPAATRAASGRAAQRRRWERLGRCEPALRRRRLVPRANSRNGTREAIVCTSALGGAGGTAAAMLENSGGHRPGSGAAACAARRRSPHSGAFRCAFSLPGPATSCFCGYRWRIPNILSSVDTLGGQMRGRAALPAQCACLLAPRQSPARVRRRKASAEMGLRRPSGCGAPGEVRKVRRSLAARHGEAREGVGSGDRVGDHG